MIAQLGPGDTETKWFAVVVTHKALALAGLGREEDAIWYWHVALNLYPIIEQTDMSMYGAPAAFLKQYPFTTQFPTLLELRAAAPLPANVQPPKVVKRVEPVYPNGAKAFGVSGIVIVECVIDKSGVLRDVHMRKGLPAATLSYTTMEALRRWTFEPATVDGKPVDVLFNLTVNFKLR
jgi:TonB family protein